MRRWVLAGALASLLVAAAVLFSLKGREGDQPSPNDSPEVRPADPEKPSGPASDHSIPAFREAASRPDASATGPEPAAKTDPAVCDPGIPAALGEVAAAVRGLYEKGQLHREWTEAERNSLIDLLNQRFPGRWIQALIEACKRFRGQPEEEYILYLFARLDVKEAESCALDSLAASGGQGTVVLYYLFRHGPGAAGTRVRGLLDTWNPPGQPGALKPYNLERLYALMAQSDPAAAFPFLHDRFMGSADVEERRRCLDFLASMARPEDLPKLQQALAFEKDEESRKFIFRAMAKTSSPRSEEVDVMAACIPQEKSEALRAALVGMIARKTPRPGGAAGGGVGARVRLNGVVDTPYLSGTQFMEMESYLVGRVESMKADAQGVSPMPYTPDWQDRILGPLEAVRESDPSALVRSDAVQGLLEILSSSEGLPDAESAQARAVRALEAAAQGDASGEIRWQATKGLKKAGRMK